MQRVFETHGVLYRIRRDGDYVDFEWQSLEGDSQWSLLVDLVPVPDPRYLYMQQDDVLVESVAEVIRSEGYDTCIGKLETLPFLMWKAKDSVAVRKLVQDRLGVDVREQLEVTLRFSDPGVVERSISKGRYKQWCWD